MIIVIEKWEKAKRMKTFRKTSRPVNYSKKRNGR